MNHLPDSPAVSRFYGAEGGTRTPTPLRVHGPEPCASANSTTSAIHCVVSSADGRIRQQRLVSQTAPSKSNLTAWSMGDTPLPLGVSPKFSVFTTLGQEIRARFFQANDLAVKYCFSMA